MVYLGTEEGTKGYRMFNPSSRRIVITQVVIFDEVRPWAWNNETTGEPLSTPYWTNVIVHEGAQSQSAQDPDQSINTNEDPLMPLNDLSKTLDWMTHELKTRHSRMYLVPT